jgi:lipopolysaccharide transport protein LptA
MREQPQVEDAEERSKLFAELIRIDSETGDVHAQDAVRHVVRGRVGPLGADEGPPTVVNCQVFDFSAADQTARYEGDAVLRSGADEVRAATIVLEEETGGTQQLTATGDVVARLGAGGAASAKEGEAGVVTARAARMVYSGAAGEVRYTGGVIISQGQLETRSPTATMQLEGEPLTFKELVAGEPVEVRHGERVARGQRGRYTPADETMVIEGEDASLTDPTQSVQGRRLTFRLGEDDVIVEGRDVRTEMVITPH